MKRFNEQKQNIKEHQKKKPISAMRCAGITICPTKTGAGSGLKAAYNLNL